METAVEYPQCIFLVFLKIDLQDLKEVEALLFVHMLNGYVKCLLNGLLLVTESSLGLLHCLESIL